MAVFAELSQERDKHLRIREAMRQVLRARAEALALKEQKLLATFRRLHESWRKRLAERCVIYHVVLFSLRFISRLIYDKRIGRSD